MSDRQNQQVDYMCKNISSIVVLLALLGAGCSNLLAGDIKVEPVRFSHPDEFVSGQGFMALADRRIFAVMAFVNAMGYDNEAEGKQMHPVRIKVRNLLSDNLAGHPKKVKVWRKYYETRKLAIFQYLDYALSLNADWPFRRIRPDSELGYSVTAKKLKDFPAILNDFCRTVKLDEVWEKVKADYITEIKRYNIDGMQHQMDFLWEYLRMERQDTLTLVNVPNLLDTHYHAIGAHYENYYFTVESPGSHAYGLNTHEYLHSIVNPLVMAATVESDSELFVYYKAGKDKPIVQTYRDPVTFTFECLVRALDIRLRVLLTDDPAYKKLIEDRVDELTEQGLTLTRAFYNMLVDYEQNEQSFDQFVPIMLRELPAYKQ
jgi:hypothetical protein